MGRARQRSPRPDELRREHDLLSRLMDTSPAGIVRLDREGRIQFANGRAEQVLRLTRREIGARTYDDPQWRITDYEGEPFDADELPFPVVTRTGRAVHDVRHAIEPADGPRVLLSINATPLLDERGGFDGVVATVEDVTERVRAERALRETTTRLERSESRYRFFMENLPGIAYQFDARHDRPVFFHGAVEEITGYRSVDFLEGRIRWDQMVHPDDRAVFAGEARKLSGEPPRIVDHEYRILRRDGAVRWVRDVGQSVPAAPSATGLVNGLVWDVTERRLADEARRSEEVRLRSIFRASPTGIGLVVNRVLLQVNERICEMTGYTREELVGRSARMLYPTQEEFEYVGREKYAQIDRAGIGSVETRWQRKDGQIIDILLSSVPLDPSDLAAGVTFTALDITERKRAAEEHRQMQAQVQHVQKLESLGVLAGGIAHDFNNLLMAVLGNADLAMRSLSPVSPAQSYLREIESASRRAGELCRQMLAYSGKGRFVVEPLDLNEVVREMTRMLEVSISKSAVLKYNLAHNLPAVESDVTQVRQVLMNLITNASEAIGDRSGIISISTGARRCDRACLAGAYIAESLTEGPFVYVEVADTGCGMTPEVKSSIFDPFFTTKFTGRGLGMAAVLGIVRGHKGAIRVDSAPGKGTTITVLFPASERPAARSTGERETNGEWKGSGTILVVDDDETVRLVTEAMLDMMGFAVILAGDGHAAIETFRRRHSEIACVLLDLTMPHMDGEEAYRELRRIDENVRIVMSSGYNQQEVTQRFAGEGLAGFIQKPFQFDALRATLRSVLGG